MTYLFVPSHEVIVFQGRIFTKCQIYRSIQMIGGIQNTGVKPPLALQA